MWHPADIAEAACRGLANAEATLAAEGAVHGLDSLSELRLHDLLAAALAAPGLTVLREVPYPGPEGSRAKRPDLERCDMVLLPAGCTALADPVQQTIDRDKGVGTLFESIPDAPPAPTICPPQDAFWLEVKVVGQFAPRAGVPEPNPAYASELIAALRDDLGKLSREPRAPHAGVLLLLYTAGEHVARHDLGVALHRVLDRGVAFRGPDVRTTPIADRIGNSLCTVVLAQSIPG
jgi:hypothetical protein